MEQDNFPLPFKEKDFLNMLSNDIYQVLVARINNLTIGYVSFTKMIDECQIINIAVDSSYRKMGIGGKIMEALMKYCKDYKLTKIFLEVRESNKNAIRLYEKYGFFTVGVSKGHFSSPKENAILMNYEF